MRAARWGGEFNADGIGEARGGGVERGGEGFGDGEVGKGGGGLAGGLGRDEGLSAARVVGNCVRRRQLARLYQSGALYSGRCSRQRRTRIARAWTSTSAPVAAEEERVRQVGMQAQLAVGAAVFGKMIEKGWIYPAL